jgi:hypothetical protein
MSNRFILVLFVVLGLTLVGCSGKRGPAGPSATTECLTCHADDSNMRAIAGQWGNSVHASGTNINRNTPPCSGCHTGLGFISRISNGVIDTIPQPDVISCFDCHEPHTNKNFNLRTDSPVTLIQGGTFDRGLGNLCANCHQARTPSPNIPLVETDTGSIRITSPFWGPHDGPQSNVLIGQSAFVFTGATYHNSPHATLVTNGCPTCHMPTPFSNQAGGHTMKMTYTSNGSDVDLTTGCNQTGCHSGLTDFNHNNAQDSVMAKVVALRTILLADSILLASDPTYRTVNAPITLSITRAGALYNYLLVTEERSNGVHNTQFDLDILNASIEALTPSTLASRR